MDDGIFGASSVVSLHLSAPSARLGTERMQRTPQTDPHRERTPTKGSPAASRLLATSPDSINLGLCQFGALSPSNRGQRAIIKLSLRMPSLFYDLLVVSGISRLPLELAKA